MSLIDKLNSSYKYVCDNSKYVKINYDKIDELINNTDFSKIKYWLASNPFGIMDMDLEDIIKFLLVYHTIGDYCFWGDPKWEIETSDGKLDGSYYNIFLKQYYSLDNDELNIGDESANKSQIGK